MLLLIAVPLGAAAVHPTLSLLISPSVYYHKRDLIITEHSPVHQKHKSSEALSSSLRNPFPLVEAQFQSREENN